MSAVPPANGGGLMVFLEDENEAETAVRVVTCGELLPTLLALALASLNTPEQIDDDTDTSSIFEFLFILLKLLNGLPPFFIFTIDNDRVDLELRVDCSP